VNRSLFVQPHPVYLQDEQLPELQPAHPPPDDDEPPPLTFAQNDDRSRLTSFDPHFGHTTSETRLMEVSFSKLSLHFGQWNS